MTKYRLRAVLFVFIAFMLGCNEYMIVGVLPDIASEFHVSLTLLGYLVTIFAIVYAVSTPLVTTLTNRWPRHQVLLVLMIIFLIGNTWSALSKSYLSLLLSRVLTACVAGAIISIVLVLANFIAPLNKRASLLSWVFAGFSLASVIGLPISTLISTTLTWHDSFWLITIITIIVFGLLLWLVPRNSPQTRGKFKTQFSLFANSQVLLGVLFIVGVNGADYTFYTYIRPLITSVMGLSNHLLNIVLFALGICFVIGNKFGGFLADHGGMPRLAWVYLGMTILLLLLGSIWQWAWLACIACGLICAMIACYGASTQVMFLDIAEKHYPQSLDLASSLNSIFANIGISIGSFTASQVVRFTKVANVGYFAAIYSLIALLIVLLITRQLKTAN
ncbi:MAG: MFS transporter [Lactobacillus sp.]|jgi:predicted MFS family arabinose efflux permease|nr:MFS transporter [Lactobacillus sp.]